MLRRAARLEQCSPPHNTQGSATVTPRGGSTADVNSSGLAYEMTR